jgi:ABC-type antimicrobial peptide transport system permease subunit
MTLPSPRTDWYSKSAYEDIQKGISDYFNAFIEEVGFYPVQAKLYIVQDMLIYNIALIFFNLIFDIVLLIFIVISVLLIYSLLLIGVETKTQETGIMRMVGISTNGIVIMVFLQGVMFVIPAIITGFALCFPLIGLCYTQIFEVKL